MKRDFIVPILIFSMPSGKGSESPGMEVEAIVRGVEDVVFWNLIVIWALLC